MARTRCNDHVVGAILASWRYDISGISPEMRRDYEQHFAECGHCSSRLKFHRSLDVSLAVLTTLAVFFFLFALAVLQHIKPLEHVAFNIFGLDISVSPFTIPHDAADPVGFVFQAEGVRMALATDLGYIPPNVKAQLRNVDLLLLESNHDLEMLRDGPYPWSVKQRVLSRVGHLSNEAAADFLETSYDGQATYVILGHLSESNNLPDLARVTAERALVGRASLLANRLLLAGQHEPLAPISF